ncbi:hypothetical protein DFJ63DRAFT_343516 [Scheffersomyces coipomensis]|uniref:uncharacterized protein n=1 Tax=Scheffersomyces coipomensis TaxID=1788519 RepID=UPI00315DE686
MEEFLRESPLDYNSTQSTSSTTTPNNNYNAFNSSQNNNNNNNNNNGNTNSDSTGFDFDLDYENFDNTNFNDVKTINTNNLNPNNFSNDTYNAFDTLSNQNTLDGNYLSPSNSNFNNFNDITISNNLNPANFNMNTNTSSFDATIGSGSNSFTNEPFFDTYGTGNDNRKSISNQALSPGLPPTINIQQQIHFPNNNQAGLDELISPPNEGTSFLDPQYFSPRLGSIPESNAPPESNILSTSYLSPQQNQNLRLSNFDSNDLASPNQANFLNSPPQFPLSSIPYVPQAEFSTSIPINSHMRSNKNKTSSNNNNDTLSPLPSSSQLSTSVPSNSRALLDPTPTKQLTKEEKTQRRKLFHNEVERRRRELIKQSIDNLRSKVPPSLLNPQLIAVQELQKNSDLNSKEINDLLSSIKVKETKPNKVAVLTKSVDYVKHLKYVLSQQEQELNLINSRILELENQISTGRINQNPRSTNINPNYNNNNFNITNDYNQPILNQLTDLNNTNLGDFSNINPANNFNNNTTFNTEDYFSDILSSGTTGNNNNNTNNKTFNNNFV